METSYYWGGTATGDATSAPYSDDEFSDLWSMLFTYDRTTQGVIYTARTGYTGMLAVSNPSGSTIRIATGLAMVDGKVYVNTANIDEAVDVPASGTNHYTVVLRKNFAAQTVRSDILEAAGNSDGGTSTAVGAPSVTQTDGTTWEISLATIGVTSGPTVTITDTRRFINTQIDGSVFTGTTLREILGVISVADGGIDTDQIADNAVTAAKIENKTRTYFISADAGYNNTDGTYITRRTLGLQLPTSKFASAYSSFYCPEDFVSDMTVLAVLYPSDTGNAVIALNAFYGAVGEMGSQHSNTSGISAISLTDSHKYETSELAVTNLSAGDSGYFELQRDGASGSDTLNDYVWVVGFLVSYTADS